MEVRDTAPRVEGSTAVTIGNFDGVHLGHREIIGSVVERAQELGLTSVAVTFDPHPVRYLAPPKAPPLIATTAQKIRLLSETGLDILWVLPFGEELARLTASHFAQDYVAGLLRARVVSVGHNFTFGHRALGTAATLREVADLEVIEVPEVRWRGRGVSSTAIRGLIQTGMVTDAGRMLGRFVEIEGTVVQGDGRGRRVTVPTLNLAPENEVIPRPGVYMTRVAIDEGPFLDAVTNVGTNPTFGAHGLRIETYVLERAVEVDRARLRIQFIKRIRNEIRFESAADLKRQIESDVRKTLRFFARWKVLAHDHSH